ncbi:MAG: ATP diphosphatase [Pseudohongiellaceae bacterium]|jgi:ATP diphosphatase
MSEPIYSIEDLQYLMARLRDPKDGCPWDKEQSFKTIVPHTLEESYELADAIAKGDMDHIKEELGDVLFQVIFYSQLGKEQCAFQFDDVVSDLTSKLVRRHPHVFPKGTLQSRVGEQNTSTKDIKETWETIKSQERQDKSQHSVLDDVPLALPALNRAAKLQKRAARVGFDWPTIEPVIAKLHEELGELMEAQKACDTAAIESEMGDVLFCCVNLARHVQVNPESALRSTNQKFEQRFRYIEQQLQQQGVAIENTGLDELDKLWDEAKLELNN